MQPISVLFTVPETDLPSVLTAMRQGRLPVQAWDRAETTQLASGTLQTVDNQIDTTTGTIRLRAVFTNADEKLFPNQFVNIVLNLSTLRDATVVPTATIQRASFGTFVYAITDDNKATVRRVTLGPTEAERVAITQGLSPGDRVVLEGVDALREGVTVEVVAATTDRDAPVAPPRPRGQRGAPPGETPGQAPGKAPGQPTGQAPGPKAETRR
jgi:multidrug efflux system membrane fusion protein